MGGHVSERSATARVAAILVNGDEVAAGERLKREREARGTQCSPCRRRGLRRWPAARLEEVAGDEGECGGGVRLKSAPAVRRVSGESEVSLG